MQIFMTFVLLVFLCYSLFYVVLNIVSCFFDRILDTKNDEDNDSDADSIL